ncbi:MAG: CAP domain-containing protein [Planctomycetes bacterium]|nr:CAP domain-containing protein [Planctomycetota bacterium]
MVTPRLTWAIHLALLATCALGAVGCGGSSRSSSGGGGGGAGTTNPGQVGSNYWYVNDAFGNPLKTHDATEATFAQEVLSLTNQQRANNGLPWLLADGAATQAAKAHVEDMRGRGYFAHNTPEGWSPLDRLQLLGASGFTRVGENIAMGQPTPQAVVTAWMNSPGHRANILDPAYTHLGVGVVRSPGPYWAQVFLTRP